MIDLKPCPMCGKEAALGTTKIQRQADHSGRYKEFTGHHVNCIWCGVSNRGIAEGFETPEKAAEHWNKRTVTEVVPKGMVLLPVKAVALAWRIAKERRDDSIQAVRYAEDAERELQELSAAGLDKHLPTFEEVKIAWNADLTTHVETDRCGFDRNSSISEDRYVCDCGWREPDEAPVSPLVTK